VVACWWSWRHVSFQCQTKCAYLAGSLQLLPHFFLYSDRGRRVGCAPMQLAFHSLALFMLGFVALYGVSVFHGSLLRVPEVVDRG